MHCEICRTIITTAWEGKPETSPRGPATAWVKILKENRFSV